MNEAVAEDVSPELQKLAQDIESGRDGIAVPTELVEESEEKLDVVERKSVQQLIKEMKTGEKLKLAMRGNREARVILIRDTTLLVRRFVLMNPRISDDEVLQLARNRQIDRELIAILVRNKEWMNNYQIRHALVSNPKTPLPVALRMVQTLSMRDLRMMAKSRNIPSAVNSAAKRIVLRKGGN